MCWCQKKILKNKKISLACISAWKAIWKATATTLPNTHYSRFYFSNISFRDGLKVDVYCIDMPFGKQNQIGARKQKNDDTVYNTKASQHWYAIWQTTSVWTLLILPFEILVDICPDGDRPSTAQFLDNTLLISPWFSLYCWGGKALF